MKNPLRFVLYLFLAGLIVGCTNSAISTPLSDLTGRYYFGGDTSFVVDLLPDGSVYIPDEPLPTVHDTYTVSGHQITFTGESCNNATGVYKWSLQQDVLQLALVNDTCTARSRIFTQTLKKLPQQFPYATIVSESKKFNQPDYNQSTLDSAGNFFTTDGMNGIYKYNPDGSLIQSWTSLTYTVGVVVDNQGNIYVSNFDDATIHKLDPTGKELMSWKVDGGNVGPVGIDLDAQGNLYVALHRIHNHYVEKYSPDGKLLMAFAPGPGTLDGQIGAGDHSGPEELAVDPDGNIYVADHVNNRLVKFDASGNFLYNITGDGERMLSGPGNVNVDSKGNVYTEANGALWEFDSTGKYIGEWFLPRIGNIVIDSHNNIFLIDRSIMKIELPAP